jgi:outer membrane protein OmpA-like peptidoglycan-associated protein
MRLWHSFKAALPAALFVLPAGAAVADCAALDREIKSALAANASYRYQQLYRAMVEDVTCDGAYRDQVGRAMARSALTTLPDNSGPVEIAGVAQFGRPWQVMVALGDAYFEKQNWPNAVTSYEEALDDMRNTTLNPKPPPEDVERRTYKRAIEARALAPNYVVTRQFRGKKSGLASPVFRNFTAEAVPVPVRFNTDSDQLTEDGITAVEDIYAYLQTASPDHVTIIGHTDPRGGDDYNIDLSRRRAEAVKAYLVGLGYKGDIETIAKGKTEPFAPDDPSRYGQEEIFAFDRRVEYKIGGE